MSILVSLDQQAKMFFHDKEYGIGIQTLVIRIICVDPSFDAFSIPIKKYTKTKKQLEYGVKFDYEKFKNATEKENIEMISEAVTNSLSVVNELKIKDFELDKFRNDVVIFFNQKTKESSLEKQTSNTELNNPSRSQQSGNHVNEDYRSESRKSCLIRLLNEKKYIHDGFSYTGAFNESERKVIEKELNDFIEELIKKDTEINTQDQLLKSMRQFLYSSSSSDTENREYLASYMEKILDVYSISSSDGLLNEWMYGFNPK